MKKYIVYTPSRTLEVTAEKVERYFTNSVTNSKQPTRLVFITGDLIVAEFYCDRIYGWMEEREIEDER